MRTITITGIWTGRLACSMEHADGDYEHLGELDPDEYIRECAAARICPDWAAITEARAQVMA